MHVGLCFIFAVSHLAFLFLQTTRGARRKRKTDSDLSIASEGSDRSMSDIDDDVKVRSLLDQELACHRF